MELALETCDVCGAGVRELRRGRCWGCYNRWVESRPVGLGAACNMCGERRRSLLRSVELLGTWVPMCHGCTGQVMCLSPLPQSISEIRAALRRDRRRAERRWGKKDTRVFRYERRLGERRLGRDVELDVIEDEMIIEISELVAELDGLSSKPEPGELTRIHEQPQES